MILVHYTDYKTYKTDVPAVLGTGSNVKTFIRDGIAVGTGLTIIAADVTEQLVMRCTQVTKPPTLALDFPSAKYVADVQVV